MSSPTHHRAIVVETPSSHPNLSIITRPTPIPGPNKILIRVKYVSLNPADNYIKQFNPFGQEYPMVLGLDVAGTVEKLGDGVEGLEVGEEVIFNAVLMKNDECGLQEFSLASADEVIKVPKTLPLERASGIPLPLSTAIMGLYNPDRPESHKALSPPWEDRGRNQAKGQPLVVFAGATSVGQLILQLAKLSGFSPIITTASLKNESLLRSLGATHVVDRSSPNFISEISTILASSPTIPPLKLIVNLARTWETHNLGWEKLLAPVEGATFADICLAKDLDSDKLAKGVKEGKLHDEVYRNTREKLIGKSAAKGIPGLLGSGEIKPNEIQILPGGLEGLEEGFKLHADGKVSAKKLVVDLSTIFT